MARGRTSGSRTNGAHARPRAGARPFRFGFVRLVIAGSLVVIALLGTATAYSVARSQLAAAVYLERLELLASDYEDLREQFNTAVRRTAVTELVVEDDTLSVRIRTADGRSQTLPTPYDPSGEIYVDYVVVDGRLWLRRIFDAQTPPSRGLVIDPSFETVDWSSVRARHGKAIYRALSDGRWIVTVTGDGSLGLERIEHSDRDQTLVYAPELHDFETIEEQVEQRIDQIGWRDVLRRWLPGEPSPSAPRQGSTGPSARADAPVALD